REQRWPTRRIKQCSDSSCFWMPAKRNFIPGISHPPTWIPSMQVQRECNAMKIENACREAQRLCDLYIDGELSHEPRLSLVRHLAACDACTELVEQRALLKRLIRNAATTVVAPAPVRLQIVRGIRTSTS